jgi:hypothetical protein
MRLAVHLVLAYVSNGLEAGFGAFGLLVLLGLGLVRATLRLCLQLDQLRRRKNYITSSISCYHSAKQIEVLVIIVAYALSLRIQSLRACLC